MVEYVNVKNDCMHDSMRSKQTDKTLIETMHRQQVGTITAATLAGDKHIEA